MIVLPLDTEPAQAPALVEPPRQAPTQAVLKLLVRGFSEAERQLLDSVVGLSKRRSPSIELLKTDRAADADVVMIDTSDAQAMAWSAKQTKLREKAVIWVDGRSLIAGHTLLRRPVQWPTLPLLLLQALVHAGH